MGESAFSYFNHFAVGICTFIFVSQRHSGHLSDELFIYCKNPPQQAQEENKKDNERDEGPYLDVGDVLQNVLIHTLYF
jgi:hypothetical protein